MNFILWLALAHGIAAGADGFATKHWEHACQSCTEIYPTRIFIGARPTWGRMAPWGSAEVGAMTALSYGLRRKHVKLWWLPQAAAIGLHTWQMTRGFTVHR